MKISVIIPALNEEDRIQQTLAAILAQPPPYEIIVADGGSSDQTVVRAQPHATVLTTTPGRAPQMNRGADEATGETFLFLHADTLLPPDAFAAIRSAVGRPDTVAGTFRLQFDTTTPLLRFYSYCTRYPLLRICFGDRGLFVRRTVFEAAGGFPEVPIFEDLEMVNRLKAYGHFAFLPQAVTTAARRFERVGPLRQQMLNLYLWLRYQCGTNPVHLAHLYTYHRHT